jgi:hypothetical protein
MSGTTGAILAPPGAVAPERKPPPVETAETSGAAFAGRGAAR